MAKPNNNLTLEDARRLFEYIPETGVLIWRHRAECLREHNTRYANKIAGTTDKHGRRFLNIEGFGRIAATRVIWLLMTGELPSLAVDHKNTTPGDNRWENLRLATHSQNQANKRPFKNNKTGLKGSYRSFKASGWFSTIRKNKKTVYLGKFNCPAAAHFAFVVAADKFHGEFARAA